MTFAKRFLETCGFFQKVLFHHCHGNMCHSCMCQVKDSDRADMDQSESQLGPKNMRDLNVRLCRKIYLRLECKLTMLLI